MSETSNNNHVAEQIEAYLDAELTPAERVAFEAHIAGCDTCRQQLDESRQMRAELQSLFEGTQPADTFEDRLIEGFRMGTSRRLYWVQPSVRRAAFAAAAAVLLVGTGITVSQSLDLSTRSEAVATSANDALPFDPRPVTSNTRSLQSGVDAPRTAYGPYHATGDANALDGLIAGRVDKAKQSSAAGPVRREDNLQRSLDRNAGEESLALRYTTPDSNRPAAVAADKSSANGYFNFKHGAADTKDSPAQPSRSFAALPVPTQVVQDGKGKPPVLGKPLTTSLQDRDTRARLSEAEAAVTEGAAQLQAANKNLSKPGDQLVDSLKAKLGDRGANADGGEVTQQDATPATQAAALGRKIIRNATMQFEVERFDDAQLRLSKLVDEQGGFIAGTDSDKLPNGKMKGTITLRVPPEHLDALVLELRGIGDLKSQKLNAEDVTKHYTDLESSLRAAHAMQDRLLEIIKSGKGQIKDLLEAEKQLGIWREKSEQIEGEKRYLDNLVSLSTLTVELAERDIRQAAVATESEQVDMSLETEAVDKAYAKAREVIETAKGRILQSEMKQLDAGQFGATIRAAVPPDVAEQVIAGLRQLNGRIAHFSRESHRTTQEGDAKAATANTVRHDDAIIAIQIYNLANIAPRRTTTIVVAMNDVEKAYQKLLSDIQSAGGQLQTSSLTRPDSSQQTGEIQVQLPADKADALELSASTLGEMLRHESTENPDGPNVTDAKRGFRFVIVSSTTIAARETRQITLVATTVSSAFDAIRQAVTDAGGRITQSELNDQGADGQTAVLSFDLPRANLQTITGAIDKSAVVLSQNAARSPDMQNTLDSKVRFSLTIGSAQKLAPRQTVALGSEVADVNAAVADLTTAADAAGGRRVDSGGVSQDHTTTTAEVTIDVPADRAQAILDKLEHSGRTFNKRVTFDPAAPQGALSRARIQATFSDSAKGLGGQESGWDAMRRGLETSAAGLRWSLQMLVIGACFIAPWVFVIWIGWKFLRRKTRKAVTA